MLNFLLLLVLGLAGTHQPACGTHVVAGDADNGSSVCVAGGSDVSIVLTSPWSSPTVTGHALGPAMPLPTPYGRVGWQFRAIAAGQAEIVTTRPDHPGIVYDLHVTVR
jgi:hypothetical protein